MFLYIFLKFIELYNSHVTIVIIYRCLCKNKITPIDWSMWSLCQGIKLNTLHKINWVI